jgi:hypothetical protein
MAPMLPHPIFEDDKLGVIGSQIELEQKDAYPGLPEAEDARKRLEGLKY